MRRSLFSHGGGLLLGSILTLTVMARLHRDVGHAVAEGERSRTPYPATGQTRCYGDAGKEVPCDNSVVDYERFSPEMDPLSGTLPPAPSVYGSSTCFVEPGIPRYVDFTGGSVSLARPAVPSNRRRCDVPPGLAERQACRATVDPIP